MRLEISSRAKKDIDNIFVYGLVTFGEVQARVYSTELFDLLDLLLVTPKMGVQRSFLSRNLRTIIFHSHIVFYRVGRGKITILRILHGRQNRFDAL